MPRRIIPFFVAIVILAFPAVALAQDPYTPSEVADGNTSGVITIIQVDQDTNLVGFMLSTKDGELIEVRVDDATRFGLEGAAGDRWISELGEDPTEALLRIRDQRERFSPVTVTTRDGVASSVVDREQGGEEALARYRYRPFFKKSEFGI